MADNGGDWRDKSGIENSPDRAPIRSTVLFSNAQRDLTMHDFGGLRFRSAACKINANYRRLIFYAVGARITGCPRVKRSTNPSIIVWLHLVERVQGWWR